MSKLEELIKEFCPNGVDYKKLNEVCTFNRGTSITSKDANEGNIPVISGGQKPAFYHNVSNRPANTITVAGSGAYAGYVAIWDKPIFCADSFSVDIINEEQLNKRYLYHYLLSKQSEIFAKKQGAGIPHVHGKDIASLKIPLPALPVQREIVRILDSFTLYSAELTAELTARRKQYEFYRDKLLNFNQQEVEIKKLSDIFDTRNGYTPSTSNKEYWATNDIPWFRVEDIRANGRILNDSIQHVSFSAIKGKVFPANSIIISTSATIGEHALITCESIANQRFTYLMLKDQYKDKYNIKYLFYYCFLLADFCRENLQQGSFASVDMSKFNKFEFPIPPIDVQERIVKVLDNFDAICSDLGIGLPAEIEKRQKQYEYYREKLLTFDGKYATILTERNGTERNGTERNGTERAGLIRLLQYVYGFVFVELESVLRIRNGKDYKHLGGGDIPVYGSGGIMAQVNTCIYDKPTVLIPRKGSIDKLYYTEKPFWNVDTIFYTEIDENFAIAKYIYYCLQKEHLEDYNTAGGVPSLTQTVLNKIVIPLPTLDKQKEIVDILDKFDSLCNDLSAGLPAEIEHRQKQYEYYRDKLLTF